MARRCAFLLMFVLVAGTGTAQTFQCGYKLDKTLRVTHAPLKSQTARDNARCVCVDAAGIVHLVWEDERAGNFEVYYTSVEGDSVRPEVRLTSSTGESSYPCVACDSKNVYVLWQEKMEKNSEIFYVRLAGGKEIARKRITRSPLDSEAPVSSLGPDGALHIAWHEGPYNMTTVSYGKIVDDSLVVSTELCSSHLGAFRPDVACDAQGRVLVVWFEGREMKSRLWNGSAWGDEILVAKNNAASYRLSLAAMGSGRWALAWWDGHADGYDVLFKTYDGASWSDAVRLNAAKIGFYPSMASLGGDGLAVVWEEHVPDEERYALIMKCYDGRRWSEIMEAYTDRAPPRYCSLASDGPLLHAVWFSAKPGNNEIFYGLLRRD